MDAKVDDIYTLWRGRMQLCTTISTVLERWTQNLTIFARGEAVSSIELPQIARKKGSKKEGRLYARFRVEDLLYMGQ